MVLKHFSDDNYENATALVVSFTVLNKKDDEFQKMALEWEKQFLKLVKNYSAYCEYHESCPISVSYSAEVCMFHLVSYLFW